MLQLAHVYSGQLSRSHRSFPIGIRERHVVTLRMQQPSITYPISVATCTGLHLTILLDLQGRSRLNKRFQIC